MFLKMNQLHGVIPYFYWVEMFLPETGHLHWCEKRQALLRGAPKAGAWSQRGWGSYFRGIPGISQLT